MKRRSKLLCFCVRFERLFLANFSEMEKHPPQYRRISPLPQCLRQNPIMKRYLTINNIAQVGLVSFTILGFLLTSLKLPQYGLISALISEIFWLYSFYKAWKNAN